jgi:uncharacterized membrane protein (UPF0127 family)
MRLHVLRTPEEQARGVIGLPTLANDEAYVFPGVEEGTWFHMRGVPFPLDIVFLDPSFVVLRAERMEPEVGRAFPPRATRYAVEVACGTPLRLGLRPGHVWELLATARP